MSGEGDVVGEARWTSRLTLPGPPKSGPHNRVRKITSAVRYQGTRPDTLAVCDITFITQKDCTYHLSMPRPTSSSSLHPELSCNDSNSPFHPLPANRAYSFQSTVRPLAPSHNVCMWVSQMTVPNHGPTYRSKPSLFTSEFLT